MKNLFFILVLLLSFSLYSQFRPISLQSENLKDKVQSYYKKTFVISKTSNEMVQKYAVKYTFNEQGNISSIEKYGNDTKLDLKEVFEYNQNKLAKSFFVNSIGKTNLNTIYEYNDQGILTSQKKYNNQGKLQHQTSFVFNQKGQLTVQQKLIPSINYTMKETYRYDANGNLVEKTKFARIGTTKEVYEFNTQGLVIKKSEYNAMGELYSVITYEYNTQNDKISLKKYDANDRMNYYEKYIYKYDSKRNWIERTSFEKGKKVSIDKREIKYY